MDASLACQSKLRLPGHSRGSTGGTGSGPVSSSRGGAHLYRRATLGGRIQSRDAAEVCPASPASPSSLGHIRVAVRVRPLPSNELGIIEVAGMNNVLIEKSASSGGNGYLSSQQGRIETRSFDRAFGPQATQTEVYEYTTAPLIAEAVAAARCATVFAYGATGAGKTHTIFGEAEAEQHGIILRAIPDIFQAVAEYNESVESSESTLQVKASFLEIYNESVRDLLQDGGGMCRVLEDERRGVVQVSNLVEPSVASADDALMLLEAGMQARTVEATAANSQSSRAHAVFSLTIERVWQTGAKGNMRSRLGRGSQDKRQLHSKISFIDLAGSERAAFTQNVGQALKDGARINQSLLALANCIDALIAQSRLFNSATPRKKPPYRDSKLTLMLKASLMGDGLVAMVANVHPGRLHFEDSNNTLEYAMRASTVKATNRRLSTPMIGVNSAAPVAVRRHTTVDVNAGSQVGTKGRRATQSCEITTASSQEPSEECLSEISLSSGQDPVEDLETVSGGVPAPSSPTEVARDADAFEGGVDEYPDDFEDASILQEQEAEPFVSTELASNLQKHNQRLDARLCAITRERNALLKDRQALEEENEQLRQESIEKDRRLVALLTRCGTVDASSARGY